ncbi:extracellular solute-binding protein [Vallitalea guaymasensis]|uniref:Extracellular solute-binding protein n=1 Tax=Vallitalea guaymasensis TaxID=1185412 RepID=A0A8J8SBP1_9FIRM|nr:extracellular solute-binding protein [Vallitalea guaymasensis]QUH28882.1 extracellular solute-binding protein [Vallitalea guaymasensis]
MKKWILLVCSILVVTGIITLNMQKDGPACDVLASIDYTKSIEAVEEYTNTYTGETNYYNIINEWTKNKITESDERFIIDSENTEGGILYDNNFGYKSNVRYLHPGDDITFQIETEKESLYEIWLDYYIMDKTYLRPEIQVTINDEEQFNEANKIELPMNWQVGKLNDEEKFDRYGDELMPKSVKKMIWENKPLQDPNHFFIQPLKFRFNKGVNKVKLTVNEGYLLIGKISIKNTHETIPTYEQYLKKIKEEKQSIQKMVVIEAEDIFMKSRQSIRTKYVRNPSITPYAYKNRVLNVLDGYSFGDSGDKVIYKFNITETGYYNVAVKYSQDTNNGLSTHRRITIDDKVPFSELSYYDFSYSSGWKNETLADEKGIPFDIFLEKGEHTLELSIDNTKVRDIYHELMNTLDSIEAVAKDIKKLTGGLVDKERKWKINKYMPGIRTYLHGIYNKIKIQKAALIEYTGNSDLPIISEIDIAMNLIKDFIVDPEDLPHYMSKFNDGESSAYGRINAVLPTLVYNPMHLDKIYIYNDEQLPSAESGFITNTKENTKSFVYSFLDPKYNQSDKVDDRTIEIWVNKSRLYVEIMQRMIDEKFTPETGIKVNLSLLPDENKIILSNAAENTPDAAIGISHSKPFEFALRGIVENLRDYEGFYDLAEEFDKCAFIPFIYDKGVYAIPETQDVKLLFYRKDILDFLGVKPPKTWQDVTGLVPILKKYDMNFYTPLGSDSSYKGLDTTTPFIYEFGGRLYDDTGSKTIINDKKSYEAFEFMTDLFTVYNVPITTSNFFQKFRNGKTPVGIGDANTYIQLKYAAPELSGQWGILPIPGVKNAEGVIERWDPTYGTSSIVFKNSTKKQLSWKFIKWWSSADIQRDFSYAIQSTLGDKFLYMTANIEGFKKSAWPSDSKKVILEQWKWIQTTGKVPGDYMLERELSNAWNKVVFDGENPRIALDEAVATINRELERKLKEFGYIVDGKLVKEYVVPDIHNVEKWVRQNEE